MYPANPLSTSSGFQALLKNRQFLALWTGQFISQIADKVFFVLLIAILEHYQAPASWENSIRSIAMIAFTLPAILFGSAAGIVVDQFSKRSMLIGCNLARAILLIMLPILPKQMLILLAIAFLISTVTQFFAPAEQAAIPLTVNHRQLISANAMFTASTMGALIIGMAIGEPLLSLASQVGGIAGKQIVVGLLYVLGTACLSLMNVKEALPEKHFLALNPWQDFKLGLRYLKRNPLINNAMIQITVLYSAFAALTVLSINLAADIGLKYQQFGFLLAATGIGMVIGSVLLGHWGHRLSHKPLPLVGFLMMAFALCLFTFNTHVGLGLLLCVYLGIGAAFIGVPMQTLILSQTPESMRGKVFGFENNVTNIALSLPLAIAGPLTDAFGLRSVLWGMSVIVGVAGVWTWKRTRRVLQNAI